MHSAALFSTSLLLLLLASTPAAGDGPGFIERSKTLGVDFVHRHFGTGEKYMPENMGAGVAVFDADGDGRLDLYFVQGAPLHDAPADPSARNELFRQRLDGTFEDVTERAGVGDRGYGMGATAGDVDGDGDVDLYVSNFGPDVFYRGVGDGTFEDATAAAGLGSPLWSTGAAFFDGDGDGDLDLYVAAYVDFAFENHKFCGSAERGIRAYCHPDVYDALPDRYYRNDGIGADGMVRFTDLSRAAGILPSPDGKGLGVAAADLDGDGHQDVLVANDGAMNFLYLGDGKGKFTESALIAGVGFNGQGAAEAGMGIALGDLDGDGRPDLVLSHLDEETNTLYRNAGGGLFADRTERAGLAAPSRPWVGFGIVPHDHDHDGDLDLFVANGHIIDNIALFDPARAHAQPAQLFDNRGTGPGAPRFAEVSGRLGLATPLVGRGAAAGDLDRDGDLDLVVTQNGGRALILENTLDAPRSALAVALHGTASNPRGYGAVVTLDAGGNRQVRHLAAGTSYLSQSAPDLHFGLAGAETAEQLEVRWPSGAIRRYRNLAAGLHYRLIEGDLPSRD